MKYSEPGGTVEVRVADENRGGEPVITVDVLSNGPAATDEEKSELFFSRGRGVAAKAVAEGSGIGLMLARVVAEQHNGWISANQGPVVNGRAGWRFQCQLRRLPPPKENVWRRRLGR